jgi:hypothetical protein
MFNTILNNNFVLIPVSIGIFYTFYNSYKQNEALRQIKHQIYKLSKHVLLLENAQNNKYESMKDNSSNTDETISEITESSDKLVIDAKLANSTSTINILDNVKDTAINYTNNVEETNHEIQDYEIIDVKNDINKHVPIANRKKSNSISESIWNGLTDNIIFF